AARRRAPRSSRAPCTTLFPIYMVAGGELAELVPERVWQELVRALRSPKPSAFLRTLRDCGALAVVLPEVDALYGVPQRAEYHPRSEEQTSELQSRHHLVCGLLL